MKWWESTVLHHQRLSPIPLSVIDGLWAASNITIQPSFFCSFPIPCPSSGDNHHLSQGVKISVAGLVVNNLWPSRQLPNLRQIPHPPPDLLTGMLERRQRRKLNDFQRSRENIRQAVSWEKGAMLWEHLTLRNTARKGRTSVPTSIRGPVRRASRPL